MKLVRDTRVCPENMEYIHSWSHPCGEFFYQYAIWRDSKELSAEEEGHFRNRAVEEIEKYMAKKDIDTP